MQCHTYERLRFQSKSPLLQLPSVMIFIKENQLGLSRFTQLQINF